MSSVIKFVVLRIRRIQIRRAASWQDTTALQRIRCDATSSWWNLHAPRIQGYLDIYLEIFRSVVVVRLMYASSAWNGYITETDRKRVDAFLNRSKKCGFCSPELDIYWYRGWSRSASVPQHTLQHATCFAWTPTAHISSVTELWTENKGTQQRDVEPGTLSDSNFITRMIYSDCYWLSCIFYYC